MHGSADRGQHGSATRSEIAHPPTSVTQRPAPPRADADLATRLPKLLVDPTGRIEELVLQIPVVVAGEQEPWLLVEVTLDAHHLKPGTLTVGPNHSAVQHQDGRRAVLGIGQGPCI